MLSKKVVAAFDFDGTITTKDTLFDFIKFFKGNWSLYWGLLVASPYLLLYYLGIMTNEEAKQKLLSLFLKGQKAEYLDEKCKEYISRIDEICYSDTLERIKWHQEQEHEVIIISASLKCWIEPWAQTQGISTVLATEIEENEGVLTGRFASPNCFGQEKVNRLKALYPVKDYLLYAYGDSAGDRELLQFADFPTLYKRK